jgi:peptidoglycan/LPS O-acetylase OafA/YrhL
MSEQAIASLPAPLAGEVEESPLCTTQKLVARRHDLIFLDGLRGLAAFYVMVGHARWLLWEGYSTGYAKHPGAYSLLDKALVYFSTLFTCGHQAVLLFFVLSGFVIHLKYAKRLRSDRQWARFDGRQYFRRRVRRLYPPLLFTMLITMLLDQFGSHLGYAIYSQRTPYPLLNQNVVPRHDWLTGLGNISFLMNTYVPVWGTNGPLWSLKFEWWFYTIYPLFWWIGKKSIALATGIMAALFALSFYPSLWAVALFQDVFSMMLAWWFGVLLADVYAGRIRVSFWKLAPLAALVPVLLVIHLNDVFENILWGAAFTGLIAACFAWQQGGRRLLALEKFKWLGDMSYTLYVVHFPIMVFMSGWLMSLSAGGTLPHHFGWSAAGIALCMTVAYVAHLFVERPFTSRPTQSPAQALVAAD